MAFRNNGDYYVAHISAINMGSSTADLSFGVGNGTADVGNVTERIRIKYDTGNVGIGSAIPTAKLDVAGSLNVSGSVGIGTVTPNSLLHLHQSSTSGFDGLRLTNSTTGVSATSGFSIELDDTEGAKIWHYGNENISFGVDNELHGTLRSDGRWCLGPNQTSGTKVLNVFASTGPSAQFHSTSDAGISIKDNSDSSDAVSYTHLRAHET